jgi:hypothetical protein
LLHAEIAHITWKIDMALNRLSPPQRLDLVPFHCVLDEFYMDLIKGVSAM